MHLVIDQVFPEDTFVLAIADLLPFDAFCPFPLGSVQRKQSDVKYKWHKSAPNIFEHTLMNAFALVSKPKVVCLLDSGPKGTISLSFSRQLRKCARLQ